MRLVHSTVGSVGIDRVTFGMDLDVDVGPVGVLVFGQVNSGAVGFRTDGTEHWHTKGDVYLAAQPGRCRASMVRGGEHDQAIIDPFLPSQIADTEPGRAQQPVRFTGYEPVPPRPRGNGEPPSPTSATPSSLAFRRHLDTTPLGYLRRVRLEHAHRQLTAADPARESVTAVAYRWGFSSPPQFTARYRAAYGIAPSHTLRQG
jgi:hypothetical protein